MELSFNQKRILPLLLLIILGASQAPWVNGIAKALLDYDLFGFRVGTILGVASIILAIGLWQGWF